MTRRRFVRTAALASVAAGLGTGVCYARALGKYLGPASDHFDGTYFRNSTGVPAGRGFDDVLKWQLTSRPAPWPGRILDAVAPNLGEPGEGGLAATFVGHSSFLLQHPGGLNILTDPVWSERASPVQFIGPRRVRPPALAFGDLPAIHVVLVSHNHYDHLDLPTLRRLEAAYAPLFLVPLGLRAHLQRRGLRRVMELDWWQTREIEGPRAGRITLTPAQHWSRRGLGDTNRTLWGGWHFAGPGVPSWYFMGDSGYHPSLFTGIRERLGAPDLALIPIGAYEPRWFMQGQHMNPAEAARAHLDLRACRSVAMHFGTFRLTDEAIDEPLRALERARREQNIPESDFRVPRFGETIRV